MDSRDEDEGSNDKLAAQLHSQLNVDKVRINNSKGIQIGNNSEINVNITILKPQHSCLNEPQPARISPTLEPMEKCSADQRMEIKCLMLERYALRCRLFATVFKYHCELKGQRNAKRKRNVEEVMKLNGFDLLVPSKVEQAVQTKYYETETQNIQAQLYSLNQQLNRLLESTK